jgi:hypothetical protein
VEYQRQLVAGVVDPLGFEGLADPDTWLGSALRALEDSRSSGAVVKVGSVSGVAVSRAQFQAPGEIVLDVCAFNDDRVIEPTGNVDDSLSVRKGRSLMTQKGGKWLYSGSVLSSASSC